MIQKRSVGRHFSPNYPVAPPQATQRTKRSKMQRKLLNFGLSRRRSICRPAQKSWKLRSSERALPCLHSPTRHSRLAQTWFCVGKPKRKPPKVASFKWPPGNRRYAREQADSDRHLEKHHRRSGLNCRRFPLKQIRGLADERHFSLVDGAAAIFSCVAPAPLRTAVVFCAHPVGASASPLFGRGVR